MTHLTLCGAIFTLMTQGHTLMLDPNHSQHDQKLGWVDDAVAKGQARDRDWCQLGDRI